MTEPGTTAPGMSEPGASKRTTAIDLRPAVQARTVPQRAFYLLAWLLVQIAATVVYRLRVFGHDNVPRSGPLLIVANHQSHLDPPLIGVAMHGRGVAFMARSGLFKSRVLAWMMTGCGAISLKENESDVGAMRRAIEELKSERVVGIFPEGSRTYDGRIGGFKRGAWLLMMRAKCDVLPVAIEGAFDAWPRQRSAPRLWGRRVALAIGKPVGFEELRAMGEERGLEYLKGRIEEMRAGLAGTIPRGA